MIKSWRNQTLMITFIAVDYVVTFGEIYDYCTCVDIVFWRGCCVICSWTENSSLRVIVGQTFSLKCQNLNRICQRLYVRPVEAWHGDKPVKIAPWGFDCCWFDSNPLHKQIWLFSLPDRKWFYKLSWVTDQLPITKSVLFPSQRSWWIQPSPVGSSSHLSGLLPRLKLNQDYTWVMTLHSPRSHLSLINWITNKPNQFPGTQGRAGTSKWKYFIWTLMFAGG